MSQSRLTTAFETAQLARPDGPVLVLGAPQGFDLTALPPGAVTLVSRFLPDATAWEAAGYRVTQTPEGAFAAALVVLPRAKDAARALIAEAAAHAPLVLVDGQKHDGIATLLKAVKARAPILGTLSKAHGKLFWFAAAATDLADWAAADRDVGGFVTRPGVFSADGPDPGSQALASALPMLKGRVVDLGAGWGFLARHILAAPDVTHLDLVEADATALDCARRNVPDLRAAFHWADAMAFAPAAPADVVVSNPPFHTGRAGDPGLGRAFIAAAARMLRPSGQFWMVANRHLPYEDTLARHFRHVDHQPGTPGFKIIHAAKPHRVTGR